MRRINILHIITYTKFYDHASSSHLQVLTIIISSHRLEPVLFYMQLQPFGFPHAFICWYWIHCYLFRLIVLFRFRVLILPRQPKNVFGGTLMTAFYGSGWSDCLVVDCCWNGVVQRSGMTTAARIHLRRWKCSFFHFDLMQNGGGGRLLLRRSRLGFWGVFGWQVLCSFSSTPRVGHSRRRLWLRCTLRRWYP